MLSSTPKPKESSVAQGLMLSFPKMNQMRRIPTAMLPVIPQRTHRLGTSLSSVSTSESCPDSWLVSATSLLPYSQAEGIKATKLSEDIIAREIHNIQPRAPVVMSPTGPGAQL